MVTARTWVRPFGHGLVRAQGWIDDSEFIDIPERGPAMFLVGVQLQDGRDWGRTYVTFDYRVEDSQAEGRLHADLVTIREPLTCADYDDDAHARTYEP